MRSAPTAKARSTAASWPRRTTSSATSCPRPGRSMHCCAASSRCSSISTTPAFDPLTENPMDFEYSHKTRDLIARVGAFMDEHVYPNEARHAKEVAEGSRWAALPLMEELKAKAKAQGLWNLFLPESGSGAGLSNLEYAPLCEVMGRVLWSSEAFNCSAPDTGNMEVLERYGTAEHKKQWLEPLLKGEIRSCFAMTEPNV